MTIMYEYCIQQWIAFYFNEDVWNPESLTIQYKE